MSAAEIFSVRGKVAFVTGAAKGLGRAMAEALAENGAHLALFDLDAGRLNETAMALRGFGGQVLALPGDVTDDGAVRAAVAETVARLGGIDICIANAGV
jgi:NAD(P)-dependent dehydrogenase (short-subunit alcohol dehydrogenase family)